MATPVSCPSCGRTLKSSGSLTKHTGSLECQARTKQQEMESAGYIEIHGRAWPAALEDWLRVVNCEMRWEKTGLRRGHIVGVNTDWYKRTGKRFTESQVLDALWVPEWAARLGSALLIHGAPISRNGRHPDMSRWAFNVFNASAEHQARVRSLHRLCPDDTRPIYDYVLQVLKVA